MEDILGECVIKNDKKLLCHTSRFPIKHISGILCLGVVYVMFLLDEVEVGSIIGDCESKS
jgi:hypothetical protein